MKLVVRYIGHDPHSLWDVRVTRVVGRRPDVKGVRELIWDLSGWDRDEADDLVNSITERVSDVETGIISSGPMLHASSYASTSQPVFATIGRLRGASKTSVQSVFFKKSDGWTKQAVTAWLKRNSFKTGLDVSATQYRARQQDPRRFQAASFRTITLAGKTRHNAASMHGARSQERRRKSWVCTPCGPKLLTEPRPQRQRRKTKRAKRAEGYR